jgi:hypothetical protein
MFGLSVVAGFGFAWWMTSFTDLSTLPRVGWGLGFGFGLPVLAILFGVFELKFESLPEKLIDTVDALDSMGVFDGDEG